MKKSNIFFISLLFFLLTNILFCLPQYNGINVVKSGNDYIVNFTLPDYNFENINIKGETFIKINLEGYGITHQQGLPMLPQISFFLMINASEHMPVFNIISSQHEVVNVANKIFPTQAPWEKSRNLDERPFTINREYYNTSGNINQPLVEISEPFIIAGTKGVMVTIYPFAYNPSVNQLYMTAKAEIKMELNYPSLPVLSSYVYNDFYKAVFVNYESYPFTPTNNYLIITAPDYESTISSFASHKVNMGYNVFTVNTNVTGNTAAAIKDYIQQRYNNMSTRPEFILLVGDVDKIPEWVGIGEGNPHTDLNYVLLEGSDPYSDAFIGRFSIANTTQLSNVISKTIFMENNINGLPKKNIYMASTDNYQITEGTHNFVIDSFFAPNGYTNLKLYTYTYGATTQQLINALNANQSFAIYSGHGSETSWADGPPLSQSQVNALTNTVFPFVYSFACLTGQMQYSECFGETWIRTQKGGSVFYGSSVTSYWDEDDILERRLFRAMFTDNLIKVVPMFDKAKIYLVQYYGSVTPTMRRYLEMYNCFGDPSLYTATFGPVIAHTPLPNTENMNGPFTVNCVITPAGSAIDPVKTKVFWTRGTTFNDSISMTNTSGNNWTANIPGNGQPSTYRYYIKTGDMLNRITTSPPGAPANYHTFQAMPDVIPPVITHTQITDVGKPLWPVSVNAVVTDNIGIDSVWVEWYRNVPSNYKQFRLNNIGGSSFSALFNSANSEVNIGDSIFYVIKARDNSQSHNLAQLPANGFFRFSITSLTVQSFCQVKYIPIRDNTTKYDTFYVATQGVIVDFNFKMVSLIHTWDGDVTFAIKSPAGPEVVLATNRGGSGDNYINTLFDDSASTPISGGTPPFTGTFRPESPMSVFNGQNMQGNWIFRVTDNAAGDTGRVEQYCLIIQYTTLLGIAEKPVPFIFELGQNYPNPFNPSTKIKFSIPSNGKINALNTTLIVYDILGREVVTLINEKLKPGMYEAEFDGSHYASGVYFYRLVSGDFVDVKKMVLLK